MKYEYRVPSYDQEWLPLAGERSSALAAAQAAIEECDSEDYWLAGDSQRTMVIEVRDVTAPLIVSAFTVRAECTPTYYAKEHKRD